MKQGFNQIKAIMHLRVLGYQRRDLDRPATRSAWSSEKIPSIKQYKKRKRKRVRRGEREIQN